MLQDPEYFLSSAEKSLTMQEVTLKYLVYILFAAVGIAITFYVFGIELPLYLFLAAVGLLLYVYPESLTLKFIGGLIGRLFAVLFIISLVYYFGTKSFFPQDPFRLLFLKVGIQFTIDFFNSISNFLGKWVLKLTDIIIP